VKNQDELRAEFRRLFAADMLDEAEAILAQIQPLSDDEWRKMHDEAPIDDEPLTERDLAVLRAADERRAERKASMTAG